jgi:hypothetical protein
MQKALSIRISDDLKGTTTLPSNDYSNKFGECMSLIKLSFLFLIPFLVLGCGTTGFATDRDGKPRDSKDEGAGISSPVITGGGVSTRVLWTVSEYRVGDNAIWGEEEARKLLFKPLDINSNSINFDGNICTGVVFEKETVKATKYLNRFHVTPFFLGIKDDVVDVIQTNCKLPGFAEYMRLKDRRLVININGVFFFFEPAVNY